MTTERAGQTDGPYLCRWGCGVERSRLIWRDDHEQYAHGALYVGKLAAEVDKLRAEAAALRSAIETLAAPTDERDICSIRNCVGTALSLLGGVGPLCNAHGAIMEGSPDATLR